MSEEGDVKSNLGEENSETNIEEDDERLKGDAIGNTLYSESWVLKTLMKLTQELPKYSKNSDQECEDAVELEESLETDLCMLWDMTADKEVACCLIQHDILLLTKCVLDESNAPRLTEIAIGILANLSCHNDVGNKILVDQELTTIVINLMSGHDSQTIIQIVRLLDTLIRSSKSESCTSTLLNMEILWRSLAFILQNSTNEELLCGASKLLDVLTSQIDPARAFPCESILLGIMECQTQLKNDSCSDDFDYSQTIRAAFDALVSALYNFSRIEEMRMEIVKHVEVVSEFLEFHLSCLLKSIRDSSSDVEDVMTALTASAVEAVTIYYVNIDSPRSSKICELSGHIGMELRTCDGEGQASKYASDYKEMVGDCFRKQLDVLGIDRCLTLLEPLNASALSFVLLAAHQAVPNRLEELVGIARMRGLFNKLIETYESSCARKTSR